MDGRKMKDFNKASLLFISEEPRSCDFCDEHKECATLNTLGNDTLNICKDCIQEIINNF